MVCKGLEGYNITGIESFLSWPTTCDYYFYAKIMAAFFVILTFVLYNKERDRTVKPDMISILGVSSLATIFVTLIGSLIGFIQADVFIEILVAGLIFIAIWMFKR